MMVSAASRMFSAISFGVFCRLAPSTNAIIRSMKLLPGSWVILTMMRSESTVVPPVTAERSPPDSRITGADSPVMADSLTDAMPSTISPSPGMISPASTTTMSPFWSSGARTSSSVPGVSGDQPCNRRAMVSAFDLRNVSAWALPRPSATASARLPKSTVSQSQNTTSQPNHDESRTVSTVDQTAPISTMNITGLRHSVRGSSLRNASGSDLASSAGSSVPPSTRPPGACPPWRCDEREERAFKAVEVGISVNSFSEGPECPHGQESKGDKNHRDAGDHCDELRPMGGQGTGGLRRMTLAGQRAGQRERQHDWQEPANHHRQSDRGVVPHGVGVDARESRAVVVCAGGERVQHLRQPVRSSVEHACAFARQRHRDGGANQHEQRSDQEIACGELDLTGVDLLAEVLRRAPDHQPGDEHRDYSQDQHAVQARSGAAGRHSPS